MTITALPTAPSRSDTPADFVTKANAFVAALSTLVSEVNAATLAMSLNATSDTSASSVLIGTGAKTFTVTAGKSFLGGMFLVIADTAAPSTNYMFGQVTSYSGTSLVMNILSVGGSGTKSAWTISQSAAGSSSGAVVAGLGANTFTGLQTFAAGANIASAATIDLTAATGNTVHITGTSAISAVTMTDGQWMECIFDGACPLTYNATTNKLNTGGASVTLEAGDSVFYMRSGAVVYGQIVKANGTAAVATSKIQPITASVGANALTLTLNPTTLDFRSAMLTSGAVNTRTVASAISVTVSSGSTLGMASGIEGRLAVIAIDNAGTVELAVANMATAYLDEGGLITTVAEGGAGAADSASVIYSTTARSNVPFRIVGYVDITEATAGTWASAPTVIQGTGGMAPQHKMVVTIPVGATSGTSVDITGLPAWAKRITAMPKAMSTNGVSPYILQIGDSGGIEATTYTGGAGDRGGEVANSTGFVFARLPAAANSHTGTIILQIQNAANNTWQQIGVVSLDVSGQANSSGGSKALSGRLDRLRFTTVGGTDAFDGSGEISLLIEG